MPANLLCIVLAFQIFFKARGANGNRFSKPSHAGHNRGRFAGSFHMLQVVSQGCNHLARDVD